MSTPDAFLKLLEANEDDTVARLCFADWLEDNGQPEEAERHRKWDAAKATLMKLADDGGTDYAYLMAEARVALSGHHRPHSYIDCGGNDDLCDLLRSNYDEFWTCWSIVTGIPLPVNVDLPGFRCAC